MRLTEHSESVTQLSRDPFRLTHRCKGQRQIDWLIDWWIDLYWEDDSFRPWPSLPTNPHHSILYKQTYTYNCGNIITQRHRDRQWVSLSGKLSQRLAKTDRQFYRMGDKLAVRQTHRKAARQINCHSMKRKTDRASRAARQRIPFGVPKTLYIDRSGRGVRHYWFAAGFDTQWCSLLLLHSTPTLQPCLFFCFCYFVFVCLFFVLFFTSHSSVPAKQSSWILSLYFGLACWAFTHEERLCPSHGLNQGPWTCHLHSLFHIC